jgi:ATP-dependent helicase/nuclease subunit A
LVGLSDTALMQLSGRLVPALLDRKAPAALENMAPDDRELLTTLRAAAPRWLARVDRWPPAELIDDILGETGYVAGLQGSVSVQARENVKKLRMLVRRLQNRGYLTMTRLAEHLMRLSAGDESNAVIDAADAVNLMTIHAAKGLEFPIVFVVDLGRGTGRGDAIRVLPDQGAGESAVVIGGLTGQRDVAQLEAEREEAKRLLYVSLTRARDRLYLAAALRDGGFRPGHGSLGEVLPRAFVAFLTGQPSVESGRQVVWQTGNGQHVFRCLGLTRPPPTSTGSTT